MRSLFIDVGAHRGQTLDEVLKPVWLFDRVYGFEPDADSMHVLKARYRDAVKQGRLVLVGAGLYGTNGEAALYGSNEGGGASLFAEKRNVDSTVSVTVRLIRASEWVRAHVPKDCFAVMKLNCEGAECAIIVDLVESGEIARIGNLLIDFDIRKVRGMRGEMRRALQALHAAGFDRYLLAEDVMVGAAHSERTRNWLSHIPQLGAFCRKPEAMTAYRRQPTLRRRALLWLRRQMA